MNPSTSDQPQPFRFLLYLEWLLLTIVAFIETLPSPLQPSPRAPLPVILMIIVGFGVLGLKLPAGKLLHKVTHTSLEVGLIGLASAVGSNRIFPFLYLILVIRSCLVFKLPGRLVVTGLAFGLFLVTLNYRVQTLDFEALPAMRGSWWFIVVSFALLFGLSLVFVLMLMNAMLSERQSRDQLALANEQLRQYALRIENIAILQERNRIARDIHDSLGHALTALNIQLESALKLWPSNPTKAQMFLAEAKRLGSTALQEVRQSVHALYAEPLQGRSLEAALRSLTEDCQRATGTLPTCRVQLPGSIPVEISLAVYRIVQEALTNICKYAAATEVTIQLETRANILHLIIQDNGQGFDLNQNTTGFGLRGMRERTLALGGRFELDSAPGSGCRITAQFPFVSLINSLINP